jgi:CheY-like chemotaxis protein
MKSRVVVVVDDLFFAAKIRATAESLGVPVEFIRDPAALFSAAADEPPALVIADLQAQRLDPFALTARLKADEHLRTVPVIGFFAHVQTELHQRARQAGFDRVLPRSAFTNELVEILKGI